MLEGTVRRIGRALRVEYEISGPVDGVRWPPRAARVRADGLWRTTCFEAFVRAEAGYVEINLSPSGDWAAYRFDGYRQGMRTLDIPAPRIDFYADRERAGLIAEMIVPDDAVGPIGLSAVIEDVDGNIAYWALAHPSDKPDFHHPESFVLELPALEGP